MNEVTINNLEKYDMISLLGEGTFGHVFKARNTIDKNFYAVKIFKHPFKNIEEVNNFDELKYIRKIGFHENIIRLHEVIFEPQNMRLTFVMELMEITLLDLIRRTKISSDDYFLYTKQLLNAIQHIHSIGLIHRDIKPENIMLNLDTKILKLGDFGSVGEAPCVHIPGKYFTTLWYMAPEILLQSPTYGFESDVWSAGCVIAEFLTNKPLFPGRDTFEQFSLISKVFGPYNNKYYDVMETTAPFQLDTHIDVIGIEDKLTNVDPCFVELISKMIRFFPQDRISSFDALHDPVLNHSVV